MKIPIVNENDEVIGEEERLIIHHDGLKHREIHVWLVTPDKKFIFQKRGEHQDTWPGFWDVTVGGHVDTDKETYEETAERELFEETGMHLPLTFIMKRYSESFDPNTSTYNNAFRTTFAGIYQGSIEDLKIEEGHGQGFRTHTLEELDALSDEQKKIIIPRFLTTEYREVFNQIIAKLF